MTEQGRLRVLLVEDSPVEAALATRMLAGRDGLWSVDRVERLDAALAHLSREAPDVVLLDLNLPDSKGMDTVSAVRQHSPEVPLVVLTGSDDEATSLEILRRGAQDYIVKRGWGSAQLNRTLRYAIERQRATLALRERETRFPKVFRDGPLGLVLLDRDLKVAEVNDACCGELGYVQEDLVSRSVTELCHPADGTRDARALAEVLAGTASAYQAQTRWLAKGGTAVALRLCAWAVGQAGAYLLVVTEKLAV